LSSNNSKTDKYANNASPFPYYYTSFIAGCDTFTRVFSSSLQFNTKMFNIFAEAYSIYLDTISGHNRSWKDLPELDKTLRSSFGKLFDKRLREEGFVKDLSDTVANYSELVKITGLGKIYQYLSNKSSAWNNNFVEPVRDTLYRTPSQKISELEKYSLFHYNKLPSLVDSELQHDKIQNFDHEKKSKSTPVLVIYAFINRHYILDLLPEVSVVRNLLCQGLDIFATDWGTPSAYDKTLTVGHFVNKYIDSSVDIIRRITKSDKVSLLGYCWGGDLALMYSALHPEKVKNLITIATPGDFDLDNSLLSLWTKSMKEDSVLDAFGNVPGMLLNSAFNLRRPIEYSHKYFHFFEQPRDLESIMEFFATEIWLYDSPPVIGEIYREFVEYCYKQNLLIKNKMSIEDYKSNAAGGSVVNLNKINVPFLNIIAKYDDLVEPNSSKALNNVLTGSLDKELFEFKSGHVGLMIGKKAHKELWPKVGDWIKNHQ
jgi:polyhydroxyalkanoate synthase